MKVFVYTKAHSKKIATITDVNRVFVADGEIKIITTENFEFAFSTKEVKTSCFQN